MQQTENSKWRTSTLVPNPNPNPNPNFLTLNDQACLTPCCCCLLPAVACSICCLLLPAARFESACLFRQTNHTPLAAPYCCHPLAVCCRLVASLLLPC